MNDLEMIESIVGEHAPSWLTLSPKIYYKDGQPYGLVGTREVDGITYIGATSPSPEMNFTGAMLRDVLRMIRSKNVCIITDTAEYVKSMRSTLDRYNMRHVMVDGMLYSYNDKEI